MKTLTFSMALGIVGAIYLSAITTLHPSVFWSPDEGAKFIQMLSRVECGDRTPPIAYGAALFDPSYSFYPSAPFYPQPLQPDGVHYHWSGLFPLVSYPFYRLAGVAGLYLVPILCGFLATVLAAFLARRLEPDAATPTVLMTGLATPLLFLSVLFLEHSLTGVLGLGALWCGLCFFSGTLRQKARLALGAGACLAGLFALRDEALIFVAAMLFTAVLNWTFSRTITGVRAGLVTTSFLLLLVAAKTGGDAVGGSNRATELIGNINGAMSGLNDLAVWRTLPEHVLNVLINYPGQLGVPLPQEWSLVGLAGVTLCGLSWLMLPKPRFPCWFTGACLVGLTSLIGLATEDRYRAIHGLLLPAPFMVLAWLPTDSSRGPSSRGGRFLMLLLPVYLASYVLITWLLRRPAGGLEWGTRYALLAYLLAAVLGSVAVTRFARECRGWRRPAGLGVAGLLFILSCGYGVRGIIETQVTKRDLVAFEQVIDKADCPILTDQWWLAASLAPTFVAIPFYTLNPESRIDSWLSGAGSRVTTFLYVSYTTPPDAVKTASGPILFLTRRTVIQNMTFSRYTIQRLP